jgi:hypothetical protein
LEKKKRREHSSKIELVLCHRKKKGNRSSQKKDLILERGKEEWYVLDRMVVTFPICHAEMLALKVLLNLKTYDISVTKEVFQSSIGP